MPTDHPKVLRAKNGSAAARPQHRGRRCWWRARGRAGPTTRSASCCCRLVPGLPVPGAPPRNRWTWRAEARLARLAARLSPRHHDDRHQGAEQLRRGAENAGEVAARLLGGPRRARRPPRPAAGCGTRSAKTVLRLTPSRSPFGLGDVRMAVVARLGVAPGRVDIPVEVLARACRPPAPVS